VDLRAKKSRSGQGMTGKRPGITGEELHHPNSLPPLVSNALILKALLKILVPFCAEDYWEVSDTQRVIDQSCFVVWYVAIVQGDR